MRTLTKEQVLSVAVDNNLPMPEILEGGANLNGGINSGGTKPVQWTTLGGNLSAGLFNVTSTPVLCKDGTTQNQLSSPTGRYSDACMNNGGRAETFRNVKCNDGSTQSVGSNPEGGRVDVPCRNNGGVAKITAIPIGSTTSATKEESFLQKHKNHLIIAGVLVAGYFAYKKFKK